MRILKVREKKQKEPKFPKLGSRGKKKDKRSLKLPKLKKEKQRIENIDTKIERKKAENIEKKIENQEEKEMAETVESIQGEIESKVIKKAEIKTKAQETTVTNKEEKQVIITNNIGIESAVISQEEKKQRIRKKKKQIKKGIRTILLVIIAGGLAVFFLMPTILTMANSFMTSQEINANYGMIFSDSSSNYISEKVNLKFIPDIVSFKQYSTVLLKSPEYLLKFWNSVIFTAPILVIQIIIAIFAAYSFMRFRGKLKEIIFFAYIILMLMPYQVTLVPNYLVSDWLNILDTKWAIWLPGVASPFSVFLLTKFMRRIPNSLIEAAKIDGAGEWKIFTKICVPLCKGAIYSVAILIFIDYWNMVEQPLILLSDTDMHPLSVFLSKINSGEISLAFAVASIYMVPSILVFLYGEEYLVEGISYSGGLKG